PRKGEGDPVELRTAAPRAQRLTTPFSPRPGSLRPPPPPRKGEGDPVELRTAAPRAGRLSTPFSPRSGSLRPPLRPSPQGGGRPRRATNGYAARAAFSFSATPSPALPK